MKHKLSRAVLVLWIGSVMGLLVLISYQIGKQGLSVENVYTGVETSQQNPQQQSVVSGGTSAAAPVTEETQQTQVISPSEIVQLMNAERAKVGLPALKESQKLIASATKKNEHMITNNYWDHTAPDGTPPWTYFSQVGYNYKKAGENLACNYASTADTVAGWMNSATHRENILDKEFTEVGAAFSEPPKPVDNKVGTACVNLVTAHYGLPY